MAVSPGETMLSELRPSGRCLAFAVVAVLALLGRAAPGTAQEMPFFRIGAAATAGSFFEIGGVLASAISKPADSPPCAQGGSCGVPGLVAVVRIGDFIGVVAEREENAIQAAEQLRVSWKPTPALTDLADVETALRANPSTPRTLIDKGDVDTAIAETVHHSTRRLRLSDGAFPSSIQMRELIAKIDCDLVDIRGARATHPELYHPDDYTQSRAFGIALRWPKSSEPAAEPAIEPVIEPANGIVFESVRRNGGINVCVYRPSLVLLPVIQADHYEYRWNAAGEVSVLKLTNMARREP